MKQKTHTNVEKDIFERYLKEKLIWLWLSYLPILRCKNLHFKISEILKWVVSYNHWGIGGDHDLIT